MDEKIPMLRITNKLIGAIDPVGETNCDNKRFENLKEYTELVGAMVDELQFVTRSTISCEFSVKRAGTYAKKFLKALVEDLAELIDEKEEDNGKTD